MGKDSIVGAGSLVTKTIPAGEVWGGVPAEFITTTDDYEKKILDNLVEFDRNLTWKNKRKIKGKNCWRNSKKSNLLVVFY